MNPILKRLASLRLKVRLLDGWQGVCALVGLVLGVGLLVGTLDYFTHLPSLVRGVFLVGLLVGSGYVAYRYLIRPFARPCDDLSLALRVEEEYPELNDALASTVQFLTQSPEEQERLGGSAALRQKTMQETLDKATGFDFARILDRRAAALFGAGAFCALVLAGLVAWKTPSYSQIAFWRFVEPFGERTWTRITVAKNAPIDLAACDTFELSPGYKPFTTLITNGLGAGPDIDWAVGHGVLELLQRDGNGLRFRALDQGVLLEPDQVSAESEALLDRFAAAGVRVYPKFATDQFGLTNLYVTGHDLPGHAPPAPVGLSACGEACDPDRDRALQKALMEFAAARVRKSFAHGPLALARRVAPVGHVERFIDKARDSLENEETRALGAMLAWARMEPATLEAVLAPEYAVRSRKAFSSLPDAPSADGHARRGLAVDALAAAGFDTLYVDCSPPGGGIAVAKAIVPGLEVEQMSYHRVGARGAELLIERGDPLVRFGAASDTLRPIRMPPEDAERLDQPLFDTALADEIVGELYPLYREPEALHVAWRLGEVAM